MHFSKIYLRMLKLQQMGFPSYTALLSHSKATCISKLLIAISLWTSFLPLDRIAFSFERDFYLNTELFYLLESELYLFTDLPSLLKIKCTVLPLSRVFVSFEIDLSLFDSSFFLSYALRMSVIRKHVREMCTPSSYTLI